MIDSCVLFILPCVVVVVLWCLPGGMTFSGTHMDPDRIRLGETMKNICILGAGSLSFFFGFFWTCHGNSDLIFSKKLEDSILPQDLDSASGLGLPFGPYLSFD